MSCVDRVGEVAATVAGRLVQLQQGFAASHPQLDLPHMSTDLFFLKTTSGARVSSNRKRREVQTKDALVEGGLWKPDTVARQSRYYP